MGHAHRDAGRHDHVHGDEDLLPELAHVDSPACFKSFDELNDEIGIYDDCADDLSAIVMSADPVAAIAAYKERCIKRYDEVMS